jgi:hypothetical protein
LGYNAGKSGVPGESLFVRIVRCLLLGIGFFEQNALQPCQPEFQQFDFVILYFFNGGVIHIDTLQKRAFKDKRT